MLQQEGSAYLEQDVIIEISLRQSNGNEEAQRIVIEKDIPSSTYCLQIGLNTSGLESLAGEMEPSEFIFLGNNNIFPNRP